MYNDEQIKKAQAIIISGIANGKSLTTILNENKEIPRRDKILEMLNPNHINFDIVFSKKYKNLTISTKHQQAKHCKSNPKGSKAETLDDYRVLNARKSNKKRNPHSNIYILAIPELKYYKIGVSKNPHRRVTDIQSCIPFKSEMIYNEYFINAYDVEEEIHKTLQEMHVKGEWFKLTDEQIEKTINILEDGLA
jgi:hypothetical protein